MPDPHEPLPYATQSPADRDPARRRLDRIETCLIYALGLPVLLIILLGLLTVIWTWGNTGEASPPVKWIASIVAILAVAGIATLVLRQRRR